eukprot:gene7827-biopygen1537
MNVPGPWCSGTSQSNCSGPRPYENITHCVLCGEQRLRCRNAFFYRCFAPRGACGAAPVFDSHKFLLCLIFNAPRGDAAWVILPAGGAVATSPQ